MSALDPWALTERVLAVVARGDPAGLEPLLLSAETGADDLAATLPRSPDERAWARDRLAENLPALREAPRAALEGLLADSARRGFDWAAARASVAALEVEVEDEGLRSALVRADAAHGEARAQLLVSAVWTRRGWHVMQLAAAWA